MAKPLRAHQPLVVVFSSFSIVIFNLFFCVWLKAHSFLYVFGWLWVWEFGILFEDLKNGIFEGWLLIHLWVLGRLKQMSFDLGLLAVICMYVNLSMRVQLFVREREREGFVFWFGFGVGYLRSEKNKGGRRERGREREGCVGVLKREKGICHEREKAWENVNVRGCTCYH